MRPPGRGDCWILKIAHAPSSKNLSKNRLPQKGGSLSVEGVFAKKFSGAGDDSAGRLRSAAVTRLWPRGLRSRRPHSSLISGLLGLKAALPPRTTRRTGSGSSQGPGPVRSSSGRRRRIWGRHSEYVTISIRTRTGQLFCLRGVAQTAARLSAKLTTRLSPRPVFR